jgi:hypothetical protein
VICLPSGECPTGTTQAEGIGDIILRNATVLAAIVDCNRETLISSKSVQIVNTSMAPQDTKGLWIPSQGIFACGVTVPHIREEINVLRVIRE